jgi:hypothetical protein
MDGWMLLVHICNTKGTANCHFIIAGICGTAAITTITTQTIIFLEHMKIEEQAQKRSTRMKVQVYLYFNYNEG